MPTERLQRMFEQVEVSGRVRAPYAMPFETRYPVHICRGSRLPLDEAWRLDKHFV